MKTITTKCLKDREIILHIALKYLIVHTPLKLRNFL